uniref:Uncharacterized conserved protein, DUF433 family n=1 Tax=Candidatus Kentrum sp. DK TaxID=2126562 RepID=A0A450TPZ2_9GAMM|nr:MAG: Uncharacterized conserved protein, DUF433 family [Candidatus Kentron sp. DK]
MNTSVINIDPEVMSGTPVFRGTRVPIQHFIEYMKHDENGINDFFEGFPGVSREQVIKLIEELDDVKEKLFAAA